MDISKQEYYKEHPDEFVKEFMGVELFPWQTQMLKEIIKNPNHQYHVCFGRISGRKIFYEAIKKVEAELLKENKNALESSRS